MPLYEFYCRDCGSFTEWCAVVHRNDPRACPWCGQATSRMISAPNLRLVSPLLRQASETNERSRHEPRVACGHDHGEASSPSRGLTKNAPAPSVARGKAKPQLQQSRRRNARPWMLGH